MKVALITGITGQDGSYLAELLLEKKYQVWGIIRRSSNFNTQRIEHLYHNKNLILKYGDLTDSANLLHIFYQIKEHNKIKNSELIRKPKYDLSDAPKPPMKEQDLYNSTYSNNNTKKTKDHNIERLEVYNLGAMSHVKVSFEMPEYTGNVDGLGTLRLLEAIRSSGLQEVTRFYQASTSEMYGKVQEVPQTEKTPFYPRSPYGVAKLYGYWITKNYRESYNMFACNGVLFNHGGPRRGPTFVTRKITRGLNMILTGERDKLTMGNLDSLRDWGHAKDFTYGMWLMLQAEEPDDYVLATGEYHSVREFIEKAFALKGFIIKWKGKGINEIGYDEKTGRELVNISERYFRPAEVDELLGDSTKARTKLGWKPEYDFEKLVKCMVDHDCK